MEPHTHVGDPEEASGSWLRNELTLPILAIWGADQWTEDLCLSVSPFLSISHFPMSFKHGILILRVSLPKESDYCTEVGTTSDFVFQSSHFVLGSSLAFCDTEWRQELTWPFFPPRNQRYVVKLYPSPFFPPMRILLIDTEAGAH